MAGHEDVVQEAMQEALSRKKQIARPGGKKKGGGGPLEVVRDGRPAQRLMLNFAEAARQIHASWVYLLFDCLFHFLVSGEVHTIGGLWPAVCFVFALQDQRSTACFIYDALRKAGSLFYCFSYSLAMMVRLRKNRPADERQTVQSLHA